MIIGSFKCTVSDDDAQGTFEMYRGSIHCLGFSHPLVLVEQVREKKGAGPDFIITAARHDCFCEGEIGAAWRRKDSTGNQYLSVKLDGPGLTEPVNAVMVAVDPFDTDMELMWRRGREKAAA